jgi:predicted aminopeptidase
MHAKASAALLLVATLGLSGCYLAHVTAGQVRLLRARQPIDALLADPSTPEPLRRQLRLVTETRDFARRLGLEVGGQYTSFVDWPGDRVVTTVVAVRPGEVEPAGFWFPLVGRVPYKGFFDSGRAQAEADRLRADGLDVCVTPVPAYSTLGWFDDPVTSPMLAMGDGYLAETILHELVHATVYVASDADFNEGAASFVGEEASVALFRETGRDAAERLAEVQDGRRIDAALLRLREDVAGLYQSTEPGPGRDAARADLDARARQELRALPLSTRDADQLSQSARLNDACLALVGTYAAHLPALKGALERMGGSLPEFVDRLRQTADADDPLKALLAGN